MSATVHAPGDWLYDTWTHYWVQVVAGPQAEGYTTVQFPEPVEVVVAVRTSQLSTDDYR